MNDQFARGDWLLPLNAWAYGMPNVFGGGALSTPLPHEAWNLGEASAVEPPSGGLLASLSKPNTSFQPNGRLPATAQLSALPWEALWSAVSSLPATLPANRGPVIAPGNPATTPLAANVGFSAPPAHQGMSEPLREGSGVLPTPPAPPMSPSLPKYGPHNPYNPNPSFDPAPAEPAEDFRTRLREALSDRNVRYYLGPGFYEAFQKLAALAQLLPGSGTVQSTQDASRGSEEAQRGNYGSAASHFGMGAANAALDWLPPAKLAMLAGTMARTFPRERLPVALQMEKAGKSSDEIWRATGLERAADGRWTFEISDKGYRIHPNEGDSTFGDFYRLAPLYKHYEYPGVQKAYPQLANWPSLLGIGPKHRRREGRLDDDLLMVRAPDLKSAMMVAIHEIKHLIDRIERHPPGGAWTQFMRPGVTVEEAWDKYWRLIGEVAARNAERRLTMSERQRRLQSPERTERTDGVPRDRQINLYDDDWW